jgi:hypothetical protein
MTFAVTGLAPLYAQGRLAKEFCHVQINHSPIHMHDGSSTGSILLASPIIDFTSDM